MAVTLIFKQCKGPAAVVKKIIANANLQSLSRDPVPVSVPHSWLPRPVYFIL